MDDNKLLEEFLELKNSLPIKPEVNWDLIWVLSAGQNDIKREYKNQTNETRTRFETGINLAKEITIKRVNKKPTTITKQNISNYGPKIYFSGYDYQNKLMHKYLRQQYFEDRYNFPNSNIEIGPPENILHTDAQFQKFPGHFISENRIIIIVTDAYHIPRVKRYLKKYPKKYLGSKFIVYPSQPLRLTEKSINLEIRKILKYTKNKILPK